MTSGQAARPLRLLKAALRQRQGDAPCLRETGKRDTRGTPPGERHRLRGRHAAKLLHQWQVGYGETLRPVCTNLCGPSSCGNTGTQPSVEGQGGCDQTVLSWALGYTRCQSADRHQCCGWHRAIDCKQLQCPGPDPAAVFRPGCFSVSEEKAKHGPSCSLPGRRRLGICSRRLRRGVLRTTDLRATLKFPL